MSIDLDTIEGRKKYLSSKLDDLLDGINESYGTILMEELLNRLELTIKDFNDEMNILCNELVKKQEERQYLLEVLRSKEELKAHGIDKPSVSTDDNQVEVVKSEISEKVGESKSKSSDINIPIWEKKLAKLEKKGK